MKMSIETVKISRIVNKLTTNTNGDCYAICLLQTDGMAIEIDSTVYKNSSSSIFFLHPRNNWKILKTKPSSTGYVLFLDKEILDNPLLSKLHINEVRLFGQDEVPKINLAPGIEKRIIDILEMLDELIGSHLKHKEDAIISLLNTFFVYCDGQCNIKSVIWETSNKKTIVFKFKKLINQWFNKYHEVDDYAKLLNVSSKYLNECVKEVLHTNAKSLITEQRIMRARHELKFSDKTIKEICYELGFSSPDYFSYFYKQHTGTSPSVLRNS
ncbi:AraC-like DNA-binding protein [Saonia flava]|uniref:AraC-like DNA-binding protein n=1 Tax=Saonia flava TaxID=523696 RepID=A0A846QT99_9FLAO|nr:helix-turn-helix domain-containing protein [Saonia flava]NJB71421.1 AraC-like DNA-binding protein [Saonia flava]